jgi:hypothetical protein
MAVSDRSLLAAGSDLLLPLFFRFLSRSVQYSFRRILLLLLLKFHNGIYVTDRIRTGERETMCVKVQQGGD